MDPAARGLEACWVRHPTEWGGEENVVPPARDGQEARWTLHGRVLLMEAILGTHGTVCHDTPGWQIVEFVKI